MSWKEVAQEVEEAYDEAQKALGRIRPAELERKLKLKGWRFIQPLSVGDDLSVVLKLSFKQPKREVIESFAAAFGLKLGAIKSFDQVLVSEGGGYVGIGGGIMRISPKFPSELLTEALRLLLSS